MVNVNTRNLFNFLILASLFHRIRGDFDYNKEQTQIASRPQVENNFRETPGESIITAAIIVDDEEFNVNELGIPDKYTSNQNLECFSCFANATSGDISNCHLGINVPIKQCLDIEQCFTEYNTNYIKRGCATTGGPNRTFMCNCPLCNNKPYNEYIYYEYKNMKDWLFDNKRLQKPLVGIELICKMCKTDGVNPAADYECRIGKNIADTVCGRHQLCFTNINKEIDFVSRGCTNRPAYNSFFVFCNNSMCNKEAFDSKLTRRLLPEKLMNNFNSQKPKVYIPVNCYVDSKSEWLFVLFFAKFYIFIFC